MHFGRTTLSKFLIQQTRGSDDRNALAALLVDVAAAVKAISALLARGALAGNGGDADPKAAPARRKSLDRMANDAVLRYCEWSGLLAGMASEEMKEPYRIPGESECGSGEADIAPGRGPYLLLFDPLHGSSGLDVNGPVGSVFSVLRHPREGAPETADFLQPGRAQLAAGYALYGPATMLVLTVGKGTHGFTLDRETGNFLLTHPRMTVADGGGEIAINPGNERFWEPPVARYVHECRAGAGGMRERDFKIRWIASTVAQVHRVLLRGGVYAYPQDTQSPSRGGRLRLLFEANPMALLVEQAGGCASTGRAPLLDLVPQGLHQRVPLILGSRGEVERIERYHREYADGTDRPYANPLFNERSLFREAANR